MEVVYAMRMWDHVRLSPFPSSRVRTYPLLGLDSGKCIEVEDVDGERSGVFSRFGGNHPGVNPPPRVPQPRVGIYGRNEGKGTAVGNRWVCASNDLHEEPCDL